MSDDQRRAFCRILFLLACVLPTAGITYWICHPQTAGSWERSIQAELGIETKIHSIETPGPYVTILRGVEFSDPEIGTLLKTVEARIEFGEINEIFIPYKVQHLTNKSLTCLIENINRHLIRSHGAEKRWRIRFEKDSIVEEAFAAKLRDQKIERENGSAVATASTVPSVTISDLQIDIGPTVPAADGSFANARFKVADWNGTGESEKHVELGISRTDQYGHRIEFNSNDVSLPCWLIADAFPKIPLSLGPQATFAGTLALDPTPTNQYLELEGTFEDVDLGRSVLVHNAAQQFAKIELNQCKFENGELSDWYALLFHDPDSPPKRIGTEHLFTFTKEVDLTQAIANTILNPPTQSAELDSSQQR